MGAEAVSHRIPVILPSAQSRSQPTWQAKDEQSRNSTAGDTISFARPSITTGAHMPWNTKTKASFGPPRAFNHLQTVPPITILNNKQEATKLVYSKDLEIPPESPFKLRSQISSCDEETIEKDTDRFGIALASTNPNCLPESEPIEGNRLGSVEASSGVVQSHPQNDHDLNGPDSTHRMSQATYPEARSLREAEIVLAQKPNVKIEPVSGDWMRPVINLPKSKTQFGLDCSDINSIQAETIGMGLDRNGKAVDANIRSSSMYKCSGDSSLIQVSEAFQAPVCMDTFSPAQSPDDIEHVDGSSRSQSLGDNKRKHEVLAATDLETQIDRADGRDEYRTEQRALKRRLTNRASAIRATEKKAQELSKMEKQIERLQSEHSELHAKWKKQAKTCNELRQNLASTREKLKVQEDENYKLKSEMQFLRSNLAMLPSSPTSYESVSVQEGLPVQGASDSGYLGWNQEYPFPTGMPTQAEIAADLELDRQILTNSSGQEYLREWQMW